MASRKYYVYRYINNEGTIIYVGKSKASVKSRLYGHEAVDKEWMSEVEDVEYCEFDNPTLMHQYENYYICLYKPKYNKDLKDIGDPIPLPDVKWYKFTDFRKAEQKKDLLFHTYHNGSGIPIITYGEYPYSFVRRRPPKDTPFHYCKHCGSDSIRYIPKYKKSAAYICDNCGSFICSCVSVYFRYVGKNQDINEECILDYDQDCIKDSKGRPKKFKYYYTIDTFEDELLKPRYNCRDLMYKSLDELNSSYKKTLLGEKEELNKRIIGIDNEIEAWENEVDEIKKYVS